MNNYSFTLYTIGLLVSLTVPFKKKKKIKKERKKLQEGAFHGSNHLLLVLEIAQLGLPQQYTYIRAALYRAKQLPGFSEDQTKAWFAFPCCC